MLGVTDKETALAIDWISWAKSKPKLNEVKPVEALLDWMTETIEFNNVTAITRNLQITNVNPISIITIQNYSIGCTSIGSSDDNWSTSYTIDSDPLRDVLVSKSIDIKKDSQMNDDTIDTRPVHIYFGKHDSYTTVANPNLPRNIVYCASWNELVELFKLKPISICVNSSHTEKSSLIEIINMIGTFAKLVGMTARLSITLGLNKDTDYKLIKDAQKLEITGIIPSRDDFGEDECLKGVNAQWNNIPYWPKHIIDQLPGSKKLTRVKSDEIKLTPRQEQILFLIRERGSSNKVIAKTLNITESTVKLHVGLVLKKFGVKNRTQLAVFSKK